MDTLIQDLRFGSRMLLKNKTITLIAIVMLALGIGANTAVFSALNGLIFRPLPVANADHLVVLGGHQGADDFIQFSYPDFDDLRSANVGFSDVIAYDLIIAGLETNGRVAPTIVSLVSGNLFQALGLKPALGQLIHGIDTEKPGSQPGIVLSYGFWKKQFNGDSSVIGKQVKLNGQAATIIGVTPKEFHGLYSLVDMQVYAPISIRASSFSGKDRELWTRRDSHDFHVLAILKPGVTLDKARTSVNVFAKDLEREYPDTHRGITFQVYLERLARPDPDPSNGIVVIGMLFLVLAVLVLLLACTNVANIVLARASGRQREMAVRSALGAGKKRLVRQLFTESILLSLLGGAAGITAGAWGSKMLGSIHLEVATIPYYFDFGFDWRVFAFGFSAALATGIIMGFAPAWRLSRSNLNTVLHEGSRGILSGTTRSRMRSGLVIAQVAGSLFLLIIAVLFVRSAHNVQHEYLGFDPSHVLNVTMDTGSIGFDAARNQQLIRDLEQRVSALPGVQSVTFASSVPMGYSDSISPVYIEGQPGSTKDATPSVLYDVVDPSYFSTLRVPLLRGRGITEQDNGKSPLIAVVNETMARRFWSNENPIGKRFSVKGLSGPFIEVVGVVSNGKYRSPVEDPQPFYYVPLLQSDITFGTLQVRTAGSPDALIPQVESEIHNLAPGLPLLDEQSMEQSLQGLNGFFVFNMGGRLTSILGIIGMVLALVGLYGLVSYVTSKRTHEIGIRMALGASRADVMKMVLKQGFTLVGAGVIVGLGLTFVAARVLNNLMIGIHATDPLTLISSSLFLCFVGLVATLIPARRAMETDPLCALKYE